MLFWWNRVSRTSRLSCGETDRREIVSDTAMGLNRAFTVRGAENVADGRGAENVADGRHCAQRQKI